MGRAVVGEDQAAEAERRLGGLTVRSPLALLAASVASPAKLAPTAPVKVPALKPARLTPVQRGDAVGVRRGRPDGRDGGAARQGERDDLSRQGRSARGQGRRQGGGPGVGAAARDGREVVGWSEGWVITSVVACAAVGVAWTLPTLSVATL